MYRIKLLLLLCGSKAKGNASIHRYWSKSIATAFTCGSKAKGNASIHRYWSKTAHYKSLPRGRREEKEGEIESVRRPPAPFSPPRIEQIRAFSRPHHVRVAVICSHHSIAFSSFSVLELAHYCYQTGRSIHTCC